MELFPALGNQLLHPLEIFPADDSGMVVLHVVFRLLSPVFYCLKRKGIGGAEAQLKILHETTHACAQLHDLKQPVRMKNTQCLPQKIGKNVYCNLRFPMIK